MAIKTHKVTLSLDNPRVIQSGINVQSFDKQSIQISIELTKNDEVFQVPSDATIRVSLLKLARQEQKIIVDVPNTNRDSIDWIVPDYLDGYQGTVRVGVYLVSGTENVDLGYFTILSNVSDIDKMADEFVDNVFQGWEQIEADLNELNLTIAQTKLDLADDLTQIDNTIANINTLASDFTTDVATKQIDVTNKYNAFDTSVTQANQEITDILALQPQFQAVLDETTGKDVISAPEIILARGGAQTLGERLDGEKAEVSAQLAQTAEIGYSNSETFNPIVVAKEKGRHLAFGSICRVAELASGNALNVNLIAFRSGASHMSDGKIKGVFVSDTGFPIGEPFMIADPLDYPEGGRNGSPALGDFRDPSLFRLPDGKILLTFMASGYAENDTRIASESYAMIGTWSPSNRTLIWGEPVLQFPSQGKYIYSKPFIDGNYLYSTLFTDGLQDNPDGKTRCYVTRAPLTSPTEWGIVGNAVYVVNPFIYSEPILRQRPGGGYFIQVRYEGAGSTREIHRFDSDSLTGTWTGPTVIYEGSAHAKGLEVLEDGTYFTGVRFISRRNGVAILTTDGIADKPTQLKLSGVVYSAQDDSPEAGYMEFQKVAEEEYLAMFHTEAGRTIQCFRFSLSMIKDKRVKEHESAFPMQKPIGAERINPLIHVGDSFITTHNLISNPLLHIPFGFTTPPNWTGALSTSSSNDEVGTGYAKFTGAGGAITQRIKLPYSRVFQEKPLVAAARIYCKSPNRVRILATFGTQRNSAYHSGKGWETLAVINKDSRFQTIPSDGNASDPLIFQIQTSSGDSLECFVDWVTLGFGEVIPEPVNDSLQRVLSLAKVELTAKTNTFTLTELGLPSPSNATNYTVSLIDSTFEILGWSVAKTSTSFTITLADGTAWGSNKRATIELIGV